MILPSFDYATLRVICWLLLGIVIITFTIFEGADLGVAMLLPAVVHTPAQRRVILSSIRPVWEGYRFWLIVGIGAIFVVWPMLYQLTFPHFYFLILLMLYALFLRPVGFKYRSYLLHPTWQTFWDITFFLGALLTAFLFGIIAGNVMQGLPFYIDGALQGHYTGTFWGLFTPFAVLCGIVKCVMVLMHGGIYLTNKTSGEIQQRSAYYAYWSAMLLIILFVWGGIWLMWSLPGYVAISFLDPNGPSSPLHKQVVMQLGAWQENFYRHPAFLVAPALGCIGALVAVIELHLHRYRAAFVASALSIVGIVSTVGASMFPFILPSSSHPSMSLLVWDSSSSQFNMGIMLLATLILLPIAIVYTARMYRGWRDKVMESYRQNNQNDVY